MFRQIVTSKVFVFVIPLIALVHNSDLLNMEFAGNIFDELKVAKKVDKLFPRDMQNFLEIPMEAGNNLVEVSNQSR